MSLNSFFSRGPKYSEETIKEALNALRDGIILIDRNNKIIWSNKNASEWLNLKDPFSQENIIPKKKPLLSSEVIEKKISNINDKILLKEKNLNRAQLEFFYLTTPSEIEKRLNIIAINNYQPIIHSKIFFDVSDFINIKNKTSNLKDINEKKIEKKQ